MHQPMITCSSSSSMAPPFLLHAGLPATVKPSTAASVYTAKSRLRSSVCNLGAPASQCPASFMDVDQRRRHAAAARFKPLLKKPMVHLDDTYSSLLPYMSSPQHSSFSLTPDIFPPQDDNCPQMSYYSDEDYYNLLDGYVGNYSDDAFMPCEVPLPVSAVGCYRENESVNALLDRRYVEHYEDPLGYAESECEKAFLDAAYVGNYSDAFMPELQPEVPIQAVGGGGRINESESEKKQTGGGGRRSLSAQSMAARERRRKITEKTQELGKLIPGGNKMSTAEMLGSAFNYVKFMQAQLQLFQLLSNQEDLLTNELQILVTSPKVQEKLYSQQKCLVPSQFVRSIANPPNEEINQLC